jgi:3-deoxy-7-phosphoheptulonate synthase
MIIVVRQDGSDKLQELTDMLESQGLEIHKVIGEEYTILGLVGDTRNLNVDVISANEIVYKILHVQEPYKRANAMFHPEPTSITVGNHVIGPKSFTVIAGPCSVENEEQIVTIAKRVKEAGATFLRGGAYKPRTSPYSFQGLGLEGLELLKIARQETGLPIVSEIMSMEMIDRFVEDVDIIQVGARNMQHFELLKELGKIRKPILLKKGLSATIEEWLMSAEYIMAGGNSEVILCERGIRTFEKYTRNTLDLSAIPIIKKRSHLPVIVDPSHGTGLSWLVQPLARAALAVGADGVMIEVHNRPEQALSDGQQSVKPDAFAGIMAELKPMAGLMSRSI